jgi:CelD/BcsL family acetyltransferase involved in cellulose biosynthesis
MTGPIMPALAPVAAPRGQTSILSRLDQLADSWDQVAAGWCSPMQQYAWVSACTETLSAPCEVYVVVVGSLERPVAMAPLIQRQGELPRLELPGVRELYEPMDFVYREAGDVATLAKAVAQLGLPLFLRRIPAESLTVSAVKQAWHHSGVVICRPAPGCPFLVLDRRWTESEPPLKAGRRSDLRRARRRAEETGPVNYQIVSPTARDLNALLDEVFRVEAGSWKGQHGTALASDPARAAFFRRYAAAACRVGILRLCFLRVGARIAAVQFAVESDDRFWLLKIGYDEAFARCSPGMLLIGEAARDAAKRGLRSYEFLGTPEPWTRIWTERVRPCMSVWAYPLRPWGLAALPSDVVRAGWQRIGRLFGGAR